MVSTTWIIGLAIIAAEEMTSPLQLVARRYLSLLPTALYDSRRFGIALSYPETSPLPFCFFGFQLLFSLQILTQ